jgi:succinyl-CoA synthetase alpha subunit
MEMALKKSFMDPFHKRKRGSREKDAVRQLTGEMMMSAKNNQLDNLFKPQSVAVIGASNNTAKFGGRFLDNLVKFGFKGKLFPINPREKDIQKMGSWPDIESVPEPVDLAVITTPSQFVVEAVSSCAQKGVKGVEILAAGFKEAGGEGAQMEAALSDIAQKTGMRIVGPNCFGIYCPSGGLTLLPGVDFSKEPGPVGFISQSGGGACDIVNMGKGRGVRFSVLVSYGNGSDIDAVDLLHYFENDPATRVVGAYLEGVKDGRAFFDALRSCARKKPVVIHKGGLTEQGSRGTIGHTGSMAGTGAMWEAAAKSTGAVMARDIKDLADCLMAFQLLEGFSGSGAGVLAGGGLRCVEALDAASSNGFEIPVLDNDTVTMMKSLLPPSGGAAGNPADLANPGMPPSVIIPIMEAMSAKKDIHFLVLYQLLFYMLSTFTKEAKENPAFDPEMFDFHRLIAPAADKIFEKTGKPLIVVIPDIASDPDHLEIERGKLKARKYYTDHGIPCFETGNQAFSVLRRAAGYYRRVKDNPFRK